MKKLSIVVTTIITAFLATPVFSAGTAGESTDITPLFAGMEKNCGEGNPSFMKTFDSLNVVKGKIAGLKKADPLLIKAIGSNRSKITNKGDSWDGYTELTNASYHGAGVKEIYRYSGIDNGISGIALVFSGTPADVEKLIGKVKVLKDNPVGMPLMATKTNTKSAMLICDYSN
jgi:hypothetical protein